MKKLHTYVIYVFLLAISCSNNNIHLQKKIDDQELSIQQNQVKVANLQYHVVELKKSNSKLLETIKDVSQKIDTIAASTSLHSLQSSLAEATQKLDDVPDKSKIMPSLSVRAPQEWTEKEHKISKEIVADYNNLTEAKVSDHELIGKSLPFARFVNSNGEVINLNEFMPQKKLLLVILRGFAGSVCIVCSSQTIALNDNIKKFHDKNTEVVLVYPGKAETIPHFISSVQNLEESFSLPFPIVLDPNLNLVQQLSISGSLAKPTTILLDENRIVRYVYVGKHPGDRPNIPGLLKVIGEI